MCVRGPTLPTTATSLKTVLGLSITGTLYRCWNFNCNHEIWSLAKKEFMFLTIVHANTSAPWTKTTYDCRKVIKSQWNYIIEPTRCTLWVLFLTTTSPHVSNRQGIHHQEAMLYAVFGMYVVGSKSFRPDQLFKVTEIKQHCYFST